MTRTGDAAAELAGLSATWKLPSETARAGLLAFAELLMAWNRRINLTGARSAGEVVREHYPDAFALAKQVDGPVRLVDVGSGGGLPALPLALLRPALSVRLCEPIAKKGAFLRTAIRELGLGARVTLESSRAEALADKADEERFDVAISRATFEPAVWLALGRRLVGANGRVFILTVPGSPIAGRAESYHGGRRVLVEVRLPPEV